MDNRATITPNSAPNVRSAPTRCHEHDDWRASAAVFLRAIHGPAIDAGRLVCVWRLRDQQSQFFQDVDAAAAYAVDVGEQVYVGLGAFDAPLPTGKRGTKNDVRAIGALWAEVDRGKPGNPQTTAEILAIVRELPLPPSVIVDSGSGGLHLYWLLTELLTDMVLADALLKGWGRLVRTTFAKHGHDKLDNVYELARVLRVPGTLNTKRETPGKVKLLRCDEGQRYTTADLEQFIPPEETKPAPPTRRELPRVTHEQVRECLSRIDASRHDDWVRIMLALKHWDGEAAWTLFDEWSRTAPDHYDAKENRRRWDASTPRGDVTIGTVLHLAGGTGRFDRSSAYVYPGGAFALDPVPGTAKVFRGNAQRTFRLTMKHHHGACKRIKLSASEDCIRREARAIAKEIDEKPNDVAWWIWREVMNEAELERATVEVQALEEQAPKKQILADELVRHFGLRYSFGEKVFAAKRRGLLHLQHVTAVVPPMAGHRLVEAGHFDNTTDADLWCRNARALVGGILSGLPLEEDHEGTPGSPAAEFFRELLLAAFHEKSPAGGRLLSYAEALASTTTANKWNRVRDYVLPLYLRQDGAIGLHYSALSLKDSSAADSNRSLSKVLTMYGLGGETDQSNSHRLVVLSADLSARILGRCGS